MRRWGLVCAVALSALAASGYGDVASTVAEVKAQAAEWRPPAEIDWAGVKLAPDERLPNEPLEISSERLRGLLEQINLGYPGLESVKAFYESGDLEAAGLALVEYYRQREWAEIISEDVSGIGANYAMAELVMQDIYEQHGNYGLQPRQENGLLDWADRGPRDDPEWSWWINRMGYLIPVTAMWEQTGDPRYAKFAGENIADWVRANPYPGGRSFSSAWRPLEVARRIDRAWLFAFVRLEDSPDFSPSARLLLLSSIPDHADALLNYPSLWGNHLLTEKVMLGLLAIAFPEFKDAGAWLDDSVSTVAGLMEKQVYPDGAYEELTNHYQFTALLSFQRYLELLVASGKTKYIERVKPGVERMWDYFAYAMRPDGHGPLNNDSDLINNRRELQRALKWFEHPDWEYLASAGVSGQEPEGFKSRYYPWAGHAIMRDGWTGDAQWAFFDIGPYGSDHHHNDRLHLSVSFGRKDFLVDTGRYNYLPGATRDYFTGPMGHNTIMLDRLAPLPGPSKVGTPMEVVAEIGEGEDVFSASVQFPAQPLKGQGPRTHRRTVRYLRGEAWIVEDEVIAFGPTTVEARWLFHPDRMVEQDDDGLVTVDAEGANLRMVLVSDKPWAVDLLRGQTEPFEAGWYSPSFNKRFPATQAIFSTQLTAPATFYWIIAPVDANWDQLLDRFREGLRLAP